MLLRFLLWRVLALLAVPLGVGLAAWFAAGGPGRALRGQRPPHVGDPRPALVARLTWLWDGLPVAGVPLARLLVALALALPAALALARWWARRRRRYVRLRVGPYRTDRASAESLVAVYETLHKRLLRRWWRRLVLGQPSLALEAHVAGGRERTPRAWLAVTCPRGLERMLESALRAAYPNVRLTCARVEPGPASCLVRLKKRHEFIERVKQLERLEHEQPPMDGLLRVMAASGADAFVQLALTPTPASFDRLARHLYRRHELALAARGTAGGRRAPPRSQIAERELRGGLELQHRPLFFADLRVCGPDRRTCERIVSELRAEGAENRLVERGTTVRHGLLGLYARRLARGEGNPLPSFQRGVFASTELAAIWQLPSVEFSAVPFARVPVPVAPAPPAVHRPADGEATLRDALGGVAIHPQLRRQNVAVPGAVEQGKTSYLLATVAADLRRERCAIVVLDPKGDAAQAAIGLVPERRACTLLDFAHPTCGFNPLAVAAPADTIADYVVGALRNLFSDGDIRASSDRYLRNAIIAVLAHDRGASLWDAARLLSVGEDGYAFRERVGARVRGLPEFKEISEFFTAELSVQLSDARSMTTSKLDAPVNKLARLLNSPSIKRVLLNRSLAVDFDRIIAGAEVLVVRGALGAMGAGNTSVLMQLLVGMLDAALARQQDSVPAEQRVAVALKVDEAPVVINRGFAETMALKRSAGLETVACWQSDAQWEEREVRDQLDALFAHRVYFATASAREARASAGVMMSEFSDQVRSGDDNLSRLARPDARLHLPRHHAIASWVTPQGRQQPFLARTLPSTVNQARVRRHAELQALRGGRYQDDLRQAHWDRADVEPAVAAQAPVARAVEAPPARAPEPGAQAAAGAPEAPAGGAEAVARRLPSAPADTYAELVDLDRAGRARWAPAPTLAQPLEPDPLDLAIIAWLGERRHALSTQVHRRFNPGRAQTTTQRRLKRLSDAGLVRRLQFNRPDGGAVPLCYTPSPTGWSLCAGTPPRPEDAAGERAIRHARHDVHVTAWVLALEQLLGDAVVAARGREGARLTPPRRERGGERVAIGPADLRLPGGRTPHDFLASERGAPARAAVDRFEPVWPDAAIEIRRRGEGRVIHLELLIEVDLRRASAAGPRRFERYDHMLTGWSAHKERYRHELGEPPLVVLVYRDAATAREACRLADPLVTACRAYAGEYPAEWEYTGRARLRFAGERELHEGSGTAYRLPPLPPDLRVALAGGDPGARACEPLDGELLPAG